MKKITFVLFSFLVIAGCSKMEDKKPGSENKTPGNENPHSQTPGSNSQSENNSEKKREDTKEGATEKSKKEDLKDEKADELVKKADDALANYGAGKAGDDPASTVSTVLNAANYLMFDSSLPPREKYRPALKYYNKVLEIDPKNAEASKNKKQIEDIYESMGMPIPK
jgi:tetratricopeptide (TPR) repeat protein